MNVLVRIRYSHAFRLVPGVNWWNELYAFAKVSCTRSSASDGLRVIRIAAAYIWSRKGSASRSNRAVRCSGVSVVVGVGIGIENTGVFPVVRSGATLVAIMLVTTRPAAGSFPRPAGRDPDTSRITHSNTA